MTSGGREVLKWIALILMTGDHVNKLLLDGGQPWLTDLARVVFPIFAFVLAWNVVRHPDPLAAHRSIVRLLVAAVLVQPLHALAFGYWLPGNILFTLAAGLIVAGTRSPAVVVLVGLLGGAFVDYAWAGVLVVFAAAVLARDPSAWAGRSLFAAALVCLCWFNGNGWAFLALPMLAVAAQLPVSLPRWRWAFLGYYAVHLAVLAVISGGMDASRNDGWTAHAGGFGERSDHEGTGSARL